MRVAQSSLVHWYSSTLANCLACGTKQALLRRTKLPPKSSTTAYLCALVLVQQCLVVIFHLLQLALQVSLHGSSTTCSTMRVALLGLIHGQCLTSTVWSLAQSRHC